MTAHVILDLDGTLVDSVMVCTQIFDAMLADRGIARTVAVAETRAHVSLGGEQMIAAVLGDSCGAPADAILDFRRRYASRPTPADSLYPGVRRGLEMLRACDLTLSICSNKPQSLCEKVLDDLDLAPLFDVVVGSRAGLRAKPATDLLDLTLARLGAEPERCLFIGDSEVDAAVATAANMPFALMTYGYADPDWDSSQTLRFDRFGDCAAVVAALRMGTRQRDVRRAAVA